MFPLRFCGAFAQRQLFLCFISLSLAVLTMDCAEANHSNNFRYIELEGVQIPLEKTLLPWATTKNSDSCSANDSHVTYYLNGAGLRSFSLFHGWGGHIKIYVASLYRTTVTPLSSMEAIYSLLHNNKNDTTIATIGNDTQILFEFTFLHNVNQRRVAEAWKHQLHHSVSQEYTLYPDYQHDYNMFIHAFGPIKSGGTVSIALTSSGHTYLFDPGYHYKSTITGYQFQLAFASMWVGMDPVTIDLKNNLLGKGDSFQSLHVVNGSKEPVPHKTEEDVCTTKVDR